MYNWRVSYTASPLETPSVALEHITMRFGSVVALEDVSLALEPGVRHAVVGENGAGKSTLMKVLFGLLQPTEGRILLNRTPVTLPSPKDALRHGIGIVQQHFDLIAPFTVWENIVLGAETARFGVLNARQAMTQVIQLAEQSGLLISPTLRIEEISVAAQQRVEILKALYRNARVLILDEPTAVLSPQEARDMWAATKRLSAQGVTIVFIAHKLDEVLANADAVTVLRRGKHILTTPVADTSASRLSQAMIGGVSTVQGTSDTIAHRLQQTGTSGLAVVHLTVRNDRNTVAVDDMTFAIANGEILGVAGVDGSGQHELIEAIVGLRVSQGDIRMGDDSIASDSIRARRERGLSYIPEDRQKDAVVLPFTCSENLRLGHHGDKAATPPLSTQSEVWDIRGAENDPPIRALSGGNQQKLVLARELGGKKACVVVAAQPSRGLDFAATAFVHEALRRSARDGAAVLVQSLDLGEILVLSDRIAVMRGGKLVGILRREEATESTVGALMTGADA